jgi:hypothetical protein
MYFPVLIDFKSRILASPFCKWNFGFLDFAAPLLNAFPASIKGSIRHRNVRIVTERNNQDEKCVHGYLADMTDITKYKAAKRAPISDKAKTNPIIERIAPPIHAVILFLLSARVNIPYTSPKTASHGAHTKGVLKNDMAHTTMNAPLMNAPIESVTPSWTARLVSCSFMRSTLKPLLANVNRA